MKFANVFKSLIICLMLLSPASLKAANVVIFPTDANPVASIATSNSYGTGRTYSAITCFVVGVAGTLDLDIDGSLDNTTFFGMREGITATGGYSITTQPFNYYRLETNVCSGACSITVTCQTKEVN